MRLKNPFSRCGKRFRILLAAAAVAAIATAGFVLAADRAMERRSARIYSAPAAIEARDVGLLLGTAPRGKYGENLYFKYRIEAAAELYHAGKIRKILVSGDNSRKDYDEPAAMRAALEAKGVAPADIVEDYAGFRTLDSIVRARKVFGVSKLTVISQPFHCKRALYLADHRGVDAIGFAAREVNVRSARLRNAVREPFSRVLAVLDAGFGRSPHFLGEPLPILVEPPPGRN